MEYVEINESSGTIRKFNGVTNKQEAIDHVLSFNGIFVFSVESLEEIHGSVDQFLKQLKLEDLEKTGLFNEGD
jgi:hypothetical protein